MSDVDDEEEEASKIWELTEEEFRKVDEQITPETVHDHAKLVELFTGLMERCYALARELEPREEEYTYYNACYSEYMFAAGETSKEAFALIQKAAEAAEYGE